MTDDASQFESLFDATYGELRALAAHYMGRERPNHTLQPTALVNEAFLRMYDDDERPVAGRTHFFNIAAQAMRRILVDHARGKNAAKRGGGWTPVTLSDICVDDFPDTATIVDLDRALIRLAALDARGSRVVELRIFAGLNMEQIADIVGVTRRTVQTDWRVARMWLHRELSLADGA